MPLYEYICRACSAQFEALVTGGAKAQCPQCASTQLEQQYSSFAVGAPKGKGQFAKSASTSASSGPRKKGGCGSCGDPRGPGACSMN